MDVDAWKGADLSLAPYSAGDAKSRLWIPREQERCDVMIINQATPKLGLSCDSQPGKGIDVQHHVALSAPNEVPHYLIDKGMSPWKGCTSSSAIARTRTI